jgi:5'-nucleotidase
VTDRNLKVLLSCDDGLRSEGTAALAAELSGMAVLRACAPEEHSSGAGHAVTLRDPIRAAPAELEGCEGAWAVAGTPADSVKLALTELWPGWADLVVSGVNSGPNVGVNVFYSGTVGAAAEGAVLGTSAVAVSVDISERFDFREAAARSRPVIEELAGLIPFPPGVFFNVNVPAAGTTPRGVRLTRHGLSGFREYYRPCGEPGPDGSRRWEIHGDFHASDPDETWDAPALSAGLISVTPMVLDLTADGLRQPEARGGNGLERLLEKLSGWR